MTLYKLIHDGINSDTESEQDQIIAETKPHLNSSNKRQAQKNFYTSTLYLQVLHKITPTGLVKKKKKLMK